MIAYRGTQTATTIAANLGKRNAPTAVGWGVSKGAWSPTKAYKDSIITNPDTTNYDLDISAPATPIIRSQRGMLMDHPGQAFQIPSTQTKLFVNGGIHTYRAHLQNYYTRMPVFDHAIRVALNTIVYGVDSLYSLPLNVTSDGTHTYTHYPNSLMAIYGSPASPVFMPTSITVYLQDISESGTVVNSSVTYTLSLSSTSDDYGVHVPTANETVNKSVGGQETVLPFKISTTTVTGVSINYSRFRAWQFFQASGPPNHYDVYSNIIQTDYTSATSNLSHFQVSYSNGVTTDTIIDIYHDTTLTTKGLIKRRPPPWCAFNADGSIDPGLVDPDLLDV